MGFNKWTRVNVKLGQPFAHGLNMLIFTYGIFEAATSTHPYYHIFARFVRSSNTNQSPAWEQMLVTNSIALTRGGVIEAFLYSLDLSTGVFFIHLQLSVQCRVVRLAMQESKLSLCSCHITAGWDERCQQRVMNL